MTLLRFRRAPPPALAVGGARTRGRHPPRRRTLPRRPTACPSWRSKRPPPPRRERAAASERPQRGGRALSWPVIRFCPLPYVSSIIPSVKEETMKGKTITTLAFSAAAALAMSGWASSAKAADAPQAKAAIEARSDSPVTRTAAFTELSTGCVTLHVDREKAAPGTHGLHIHEK